jgi:ADP-heptose:LPS heptosyltransferase
MLNIKNKIAVRYASSRARQNKKVINFNDTIKSSQTALFLMPRMSMEFYLARSVVESFLRYFRRVVLVVAENMRELATYRSEVIVVSKEDENWLKLPSKDLVMRLRDQKFDVIFDLNYSNDIFMSYLCRRAEAKVSVGFVKENCDQFYDMQVKVPQGGDMKRAYEILGRTFKMFKEK